MCLLISVVMVTNDLKACFCPARTASNPACVLSPIPKWATVTRMWWRRELSRWNCSTPTRASCTTTLSCMPRGCRPHCPTSSLCATLSTQGMWVNLIGNDVLSRVGLNTQSETRESIGFLEDKRAQSRHLWLAINCNVKRERIIWLGRLSSLHQPVRVFKYDKYEPQIKKVT